MSKIKIIVIVLILGFISFLGYKVISMSKEKNVITDSIKTIPEFSFKTLSDKKITKSNLKDNLPIVFLYFNSDCDFCQYEAKSISESIDKFNDVQLVFVSTESIEKIKAFSLEYNLNDKENITFLHDNNDVFSKVFNTTSIPYTLIYNKEQNLIKKHKGQLNAVGILRIINKQK